MIRVWYGLRGNILGRERGERGEGRGRGEGCLEADSMSERSRVELWQMYSPRTTLPQTAFINLGRNIAVPCRQDNSNYIDYGSVFVVEVWSCRFSGVSLSVRPANYKTWTLLYACIIPLCTGTKCFACHTDQLGHPCAVLRRTTRHPLCQLIHNYIALPHNASTSISTHA